MNKTFPATLVLVLAPLSALAQVAAPPPSGPMATPVRSSTGGSPSGISVNGSAQGRIPATSARVTLALSTADRSMTLNAQTLKPVVDALVGQGIDPSSITLPVNFAAPGGSSFANVSFVAAHPTSAMMQQGIVAIGTAISQMHNLVLNSANVALTAADCASTIADTRSRAVRNARSKAELVAKDLGVKVGPVQFISAFDQTAPDGSCSYDYMVGAGYQNPMTPQTPEDYVNVRVQINVSITYAIK
jgi:uncharacterized protein YggE